MLFVSVRKIKGKEDCSTSLGLSTKSSVILHSHLAPCLSLNCYFLASMASPFLVALYQSPVHALMPVLALYILVLLKSWS